MGNICRSPTAEVVFRDIARREYPQLMLEVDSAGTHAYHVGDAPDLRSIDAARRRGYDLTPLRARKVSREDFDRFDLLFAMDADNHSRLLEMAPVARLARAVRFLEFASHPDRLDVPDPYYGDHDAFERVLDLLEQASRVALAKLDGAAQPRV
jgi:protein-tyrosine phosphatase